jgi:prepilin-type N-terminal cleavage/methylation domain-containing protein
MNANGQKLPAGLTLIEIMVVVLLIAIAVLGAMGFRLYCITDAKKADVQVNATRIASMLLENWKANLGDTNYNPHDQLLTFSSQFSITPNAVVGASNTYKIYDQANSNGTSGGIYYFVTLSQTAGTSTMPTELKASIRWNKNYGETGTLEPARIMATYVN